MGNLSDNDRGRAEDAASARAEFGLSHAEHARPDKTPLSQNGGGFMMAAYCVVLGIAAMVFTRPREIT